jgi:hypothetical protein
MDIDHSRPTAHDSTISVSWSGVTTANGGVLHHEENHISPEERRVEVYTRSIMPAPNTKDTATNDILAYGMPKLCDEYLCRYVKGLEKGTNRPPLCSNCLENAFCVLLPRVRSRTITLLCSVIFPQQIANAPTPRESCYAIGKRELYQIRITQHLEGD